MEVHLVDGLPLRQVQYLKRLPEPANVRDRPDSYETRTIPLADARTFFAGRTVMGRLVQTCELVWDIDAGHRQMELGALWEMYIAPVAQKLDTYFSLRGIKAYYFDSGQGLHISVFAANPNPLLLCGPDYSRFRHILWKEINRHAGIGEDEMQEIDCSPMSRTGESVIRACGAYNAKSGTYKTWIHNIKKKICCDAPEKVTFPDKIELSVVPEDILQSAVTIYKEKAGKRQIATAPHMGSKWLQLPCVQNLISKQIPPTGKNVRGKLACILAYDALLGFSGDESKAMELLCRFEENCRQLDPSLGRGSQRGWIKYIKGKGLGQWRIRCATVRKYEVILRELGYDITLCAKERCWLAQAKRRKRIRRLW
jgi:hypothetical protein